MGCKRGSAAAGVVASSAIANAANFMESHPGLLSGHYSATSGPAHNLENAGVSRNLERGIPPSDVQHPTASFPLMAKPFGGGRCHSEMSAEPTRAVTDGGELR